MARRLTNKQAIAAVALVTLIVGALAATAVAQSQRFPDVPPDHEAYEAIEWAAEVGVTLGYKDGTFKPERPLHKSHAVVFMERFYDEILQASESPDFTRGDMMRVLKAINDGGSAPPVTPILDGSSGSFSGAGRTVTDIVALSSGLHRVTFTVSGNTYGSGHTGSVRLDTFNDEGQRVADQVRTTGASGTWEILVRLDTPTRVVFQIGGLEPRASWTLSHEALTAPDQQPGDSASTPDAPDAPDAPPLPASGSDWETDDSQSVFYASSSRDIPDGGDWGDTSISVLVGCRRASGLYAKFTLAYAPLDSRGQVSYQFGGQTDSITFVGSRPSVVWGSKAAVELSQQSPTQKPHLDEFVEHLREDTSGQLTFHIWGVVGDTQEYRGGGTLYVRGVAQDVEPVLERCGY